MISELREAARLYASGDYPGVLEALREVDATDDNHIELAYLLGLAHARLEHWDEAMLYLEQVVTGADEALKVFQCRLALAYVYSRTGRARLAEYELGRLVAAGFESAQVLCGLAFSAWALGRSEEARRHYEQALSVEPDNGTALNGLGYVLAATGADPRRAYELCRRALSANPVNPAYLDSLGWACYKLGDHKEALRLLTQAASLAPEAGEIREHLEELERATGVRR